MNIKRIIREELEDGFKDSSEEDWKWAKDVNMFQNITKEELLEVLNQKVNDTQTLMQYLDSIERGNTSSSWWATIELDDGSVIDIQNVEHHFIYYYNNFEALSTKIGGNGIVDLDGFIEEYRHLISHINRDVDLEAVQSVIPTAKTIIIGY